MASATVSQLHWQEDLQAVKGELAATLDRVQDRCTQVTRRSEEECAVYQARIVALENHNREVITAAKWLRAQNIELERLVEQHKSEMARAIDARNAAFRKLHHSRKIIRDLLDESKTGFLSPGNSRASSKESSSQTHAEEQVEISVRPDLGVEADNDISTNSDMSDTERLKRVMGIDVMDDDVQNQNLPPAAPSNGEYKPGPSERKSEAGSELESEKLLSTNPNGSRSEQEVWNIQYSKPPSSTKSTFGPLVLSTLLARLGLDENMMDCLESLESSTDHCLRLHITRDMAFVYDPIFLESSSSTYLIDWGRKKLNRKIETYINQGVQKSTPFHTFVFPIRKGHGQWFYVGAHTWIVTELWDVWPTLSARSKHEVTTKLMGRCGGTLDQIAIEKLMDDGILEQFCVQISGTLHREETRSFARRTRMTSCYVI